MVRPAHMAGSRARGVAVHGATVDIITAYDDDEPELYDGPGYRQLA